jgi:hypothetical protein
MTRKDERSTQHEVRQQCNPGQRHVEQSARDLAYRKNLHFEESNIEGNGSFEFRRDYLIWLFGVGAFILFMGLVDLLCYRSLKTNMRLAWQVSFLCAVFTTLLGLPGVIVFGISPPLLLLVTSVVGLLSLTLSRREFRAAETYSGQ